jgi:hypothetical protein
MRIKTIVAATLTVAATAAYGYREAYRYRHGINSHPPVEAAFIARWQSRKLHAEAEKICRSMAH